MQITSQTPLLSVVVIGRNEGPRLLRCLEAVRNMKDPGGTVEIIYVDSSSTDGSCEAARRMEAPAHHGNCGDAQAGFQNRRADVRHPLQ